MTNLRQALMAGAGLALATAIATPVLAADAPEASEIVVTGTRAQNRTKLDTVAPVDVLSADSLSRQGSTELGANLSAVAPSINFPRTSGADGTDSIRPATLRGLSPDQTLVLINGVRGHPAALLNVNGSVGRGAAAFDLNTIPTLALSQVEVLRDGASAQYGSDAIAGVMNLRLREADHGGGATVSYGLYNTTFNGARSSRDITDGDTATVGVWQGFKLGNKGGFLTISGEYLNRLSTGRSDTDVRTLTATSATAASPAVVRSRVGDPRVQQGAGYFNAAVPVGEAGWEAFAFGGYQYRDSTSAAFAREPGNTNNVLALYPNGFLPKINVHSRDLTLTTGLRGNWGDWKATVKASYGRNRLDYRTLDSVNPTYGAASQTNFYDGALIYDQWLIGMDASRLYKMGATDLNVAWGVEARREGYRIVAGEPTSYNRGPISVSPITGSTLTSGAQGFIGFQASNALKADRISNAVYLDLEAKLPSIFTFGAAVRGEHYSDFGDIATWKASARADLAKWIAFRSTVSSGFRAPSLQQQYFTSTASVLSGSAIVETGTFPSISAVAAKLGGVALRPEKSFNISAGAVLRAGGFDLTVDGYIIKIRDQLGLSENITLSAADQVTYGVQAARFFINGLHTTTKGVDIVGHYKLRTAQVGTFDFTASANFNTITVDSYPTSSSATLFARQRILTITQGTPGEKLVGSIDWSLGKVSTTTRVSYYGDVTQPASTAVTDIHTGRHTITDLEARYKVLPQTTISIGANNVFDVYPNRVKLYGTDGKTTLLATNGGVAYPYFSPFGFNGRYLYARLSLTW